MIDCNITKNYFSEKVRMSKTTESGVCKLGCTNCLLSSYNNGVGKSCTDFEMQYPQQAIEVVQRWSNANPQRTYLSQFREHYPNAELNPIGVPKGICPYDLGLMNRYDCRKDRNCVECWNQPIGDSKEN